MSDARLNILSRIVGALLTSFVFASVVWSMSNWRETNLVYDDVCYLRQAHLFQRFGLRGFDTDIALDDDNYFARKVREFPALKESDIKTALCHRYNEATQKYVMQYPPGPGLLLAAFPQGRQMVPLYITSAAIIFAILLGLILTARTMWLAGLCSLFGCAVLYLMINPAKSSWSLPPTLVICAVAGLLTVRAFEAQSYRMQLLSFACLGSLLGFSVNLRVGNVLLASGYFVVLAYLTIRFVSARALSKAVAFTAAFVAGMIPTLVANLINAGHPLATAYGGADTASRDYGLQHVLAFALLYLKGTQGVVICATIVSLVAFFLVSRRLLISSAALIGFTALANLAVNLVFYLTHPVYTPYYTVPVTMLTLWTIVFAVHWGANELDRARRP